MKGIDVSNNDENIDFNQVKNAGYEIVYLKSTEGLTYNDNKMREFYEGCKANQLKIGFYHFLRKNDPTQEAIHFLNAISGLTYDCIPMLDVEGNDKCDLTDGSATWRTQQFSDYCKSQGVQIGLYTYTSFLKESMGGNTLELPLWIAEYGVDSPNISQDYIGFQFTEEGRVPGIGTNCDIDNFDERIFVNGGKKKVESIVIYNYGADMHSAEILADYLNCPTISNGRSFDYSCVKNVYAVGGKADQYTSYLTKLIAGDDRYSTDQAVLDFIKNGGK
ncbi:glycosyl hydrolase [Clostridium sp. P21]|uniref:Glycosyl hydrolase n=1 Tax=Clostridium muellerianum TaxID=2716538 RepID=A0A7Y0HS58_9CLOT|nr:GH25 family lysozyme [Clostridium muellerianum]NMM65508.1 glycosyl hydrolase [Clostridium muellerianum]